MPVVGRRNANGVDLGIGEHLAEVCVRRAFGAVLVVGVDLTGAVLAARLVDVADGDDADVGLLQKLGKQEAPLNADADHGNVAFLARLEFASPDL